MPVTAVFKHPKVIHCNHIHSMATLSTSIDRDSFYYNLSCDNCRWNSRNLLIWFVSTDKLILVEACIYPRSFPLELFNSSLFLMASNREEMKSMFHSPWWRALIFYSSACGRKTIKASGKDNQFSSTHVFIQGSNIWIGTQIAEVH